MTNPGSLVANPAPETKLYKIEEAAQLLSLGRTAVFELIRTGQLKSVKVGRARRVPAAWLDEFVTALMATAERAA